MNFIQTRKQKEILNKQYLYDMSRICLFNISIPPSLQLMTLTIPKVLIEISDNDSDHYQEWNDEDWIGVGKKYVLSFSEQIGTKSGNYMSELIARI